MYHTCLFCAGHLGRNEAIESFPVGERIAFDAWKGRLWAICPRCLRWNLAPIEERWETVEAAERLFTDTRTRVQSENIGLCRLPDGTRLVRVGQALPGELAAWRYGARLLSRRRRNLVAGAALVAGVGATIAGMPLLASAGVPMAALSLGFNVVGQWQQHRERTRVVQRIGAHESPTGRLLVVRRFHLYDSVIEPVENGDPGVLLPPRVVDAAGRRFGERAADEPVLLTGGVAQRLLARSMMDYNRRGAKPDDIERALKRIANTGGPAEFARYAARTGAALAQAGNYRGNRQSYTMRQILGTFRGEVLPVRKYRSPFRSSNRPLLSRYDALALEMALNEESERRALEGELAALEAAWREAEEIARIADALPGDPDDPVVLPRRASAGTAAPPSSRRTAG